MPQVRLIGADGEQVGVVPIAQALAAAQDAKLDLVEIAPQAIPVVCQHGEGAVIILCDRIDVLHLSC